MKPIIDSVLTLNFCEDYNLDERIKKDNFWINKYSCINFYDCEINKFYVKLYLDYEFNPNCEQVRQLFRKWEDVSLDCVVINEKDEEKVLKIWKVYSYQQIRENRIDEEIFSLRYILKNNLHVSENNEYDLCVIDDNDLLVTRHLFEQLQIIINNWVERKIYKKMLKKDIEKTDRLSLDYNGEVMFEVEFKEE